MADYDAQSDNSNQRQSSRSYIVTAMRNKVANKSVKKPQTQYGMQFKVHKYKSGDEGRRTLNKPTSHILDSLNEFFI